MNDSELLRKDIAALTDKVLLKDSEVSALMSIVIQTNKDVSVNLVKLTEVVGNVSVLEKTVEEQQESLNKLSSKVSTNETDIKLSLQDSGHIKDALEEIKTNQKDARAWLGKILAGLVISAIIASLALK